MSLSAASSAFRVFERRVEPASPSAHGAPHTSSPRRRPRPLTRLDERSSVLGAVAAFCVAGSRAAVGATEEGLGGGGGGSGGRRGT